MNRVDVEPSRGSAGATALQTAFQILGLLTRQDRGLALSEVTETLGLSRRVLTRVLADLDQAGLATYDRQADCCRIGPGALQLAADLVSGGVLVQLARPILQRLMSLAGESVTVNAYIPGSGLGMCMAVVECDKPLQYDLCPGERKPLHAGASGKAILAFVDPAERRRLLGGPGLVSVTPRTVIEPGQLARQLAAIRRQGYAVSRGERLEGAIGLAAPVFGDGQRVRGSMVVTVPAHRYRAADRDRLIGLLRSHANELSLALGAPTAT